MRKFFLPVLVAICSVSFCSLFVGLNQAYAQSVTCPAGYTCTPITQTNTYTEPTIESIPSDGSAAGTVYTPFPECDYFLIQDPTGTYSEAEWFSGVSPDNGDTVYGNFQSYDFHDIYDQNLDGSSHVWIDDYWDSESDALQYTIDNCSGYQFDSSVMPSGDTVSTPSPDDNTYTNIYGDTVSSPYSDDYSNDNSYTSVDGNTVPDPAYSEDGSVPDGATAQCNDGTYSFSQNDSGTCSYHGGVEDWLQ